VKYSDYALRRAHKGLQLLYESGLTADTDSLSEVERRLEEGDAEVSADFERRLAEGDPEALAEVAAEEERSNILWGEPDMPSS
jgi:hypothetical protein